MQLKTILLSAAMVMLTLAQPIADPSKKKTSCGSNAVTAANCNANRAAQNASCYKIVCFDGLNINMMKLMLTGCRQNLDGTMKCGTCVSAGAIYTCLLIE